MAHWRKGYSAWDSEKWSDSGSSLMIQLGELLAGIDVGCVWEYVSLHICITLLYTEVIV